jgi:hypothetical protein
MMEAGATGLDEELASEIDIVMEAVKAVVTAAYDRAAARCAGDPDAPARMAALLRVAESSGFGDLLDEGKLRRCLQFELELDMWFKRVHHLDAEQYEELHVRGSGLHYDGLNSGIPDEAWRAVEFVKGIESYPSSELPEPMVFELTGNEGCEWALDDVQLQPANSRTGGVPGPSFVTATLHLRGVPRECELWEGQANASRLRRFMSYQYNYAATIWNATWIPGYTHWRGNGSDYGPDPSRFDATYYIRGLHGSGGTWSLEFDMQADPREYPWNLYEYYEKSTLTLRHAAAG